MTASLRFNNEEDLQLYLKEQLELMKYNKKQHTIDLLRITDHFYKQNNLIKFVVRVLFYFNGSKVAKQVTMSWNQKPTKDEFNDIYRKSLNFLFKENFISKERYKTELNVLQDQLVENSTEKL